MGQALQDNGLCLLPSCPHIPQVLWCPLPTGHKVLTTLLSLIRAPVTKGHLRLSCPQWKSNTKVGPAVGCSYPGSRDVDQQSVCMGEEPATPSEMGRGSHSYQECAWKIPESQCGTLGKGQR